ncbi:MAG: RluA family pseudouridine synthase [Blautia sp.]|nr:RluA family pseudouridine synthase [Blautia sp.]
MTRILHYPVSEVNEGRMAARYLRELGFSRRNLTWLKADPQGVLLNDEPAHLNARLHSGDILTIKIREDEMSSLTPVDLPFGIIYEDDDLMVIDKPAGIPLHPSLHNVDNTLANALAWYFKCRQEPFVFRCSNRLDRDTSGLTIVSKHRVAAGMLSEMGVRREIVREYLAIVRGHVTPPSGTIDAPIGRVGDSIIERRIDPENGERAVTHYKVVKEHNGLSLVLLNLETGRTHQIRVHMKHIGFPLIGDHLYNPDDRTLISRQALHAFRLSFIHPLTGTALSFTAPLPEDMAELMPFETDNRPNVNSTVPQ